MASPRLVPTFVRLPYEGKRNQSTVRVCEPQQSDNQMTNTLNEYFVPLLVRVRAADPSEARAALRGQVDHLLDVGNDDETIRSVEIETAVLCDEPAADASPTCIERRWLLPLLGVIDALRSAGYEASQGGPEDGELNGRFWWTLCRPGWSGIETSAESFASEADAWADAAMALSLERLREGMSA
jgi:hypothetical protein